MRHTSYQRRGQRRGVVLLIVIIMLSLFAVVGLSFVFYSDAEAASATLASQALSRTVPDTDPEALLSYFLNQWLYDTNDVNSALRGHSLARTMWGYNPYGLTMSGGAVVTNSQNFTPYNGIGRVHFTYGSTDPTALNGFDDYYLPNYQYYPQDSFSRDPEFFGYQAYLKPQLVPNPPIAANYRAGNAPYTYPDMNTLCLARVDADGVVVVPSYHRPYMTPTNRYGVLYVNNTPNFSGGVNIGGYNDRFSVPDADAGGHVRNLENSKGSLVTPLATMISSASAGTSLAVGNPPIPAINVISTAGFTQPTAANPGAFAVSINGTQVLITYLAMTPTAFNGCTVVSGTGTLLAGQMVYANFVITPAGGQVIPPQPAAPVGINVGSTTGFPASGTAAINISGTRSYISYSSITPTSLVGCTTNGVAYTGGPLVLGTGMVVNPIASNDSYWIDLNSPIFTAANGKKAKALFAPLIVDLDNRIPLWLAGNGRGASPVVGSTAGVPASTHRSTQGYGPNEINPSVTSLITGSPLIDNTTVNPLTGLTDLQALFALRYGLNLPAPYAIYAAPPSQWPQRDGNIYGRIDFDAFNSGALALPNNNNANYTNKPVYFIQPDYPNGTYPNAAAPPPWQSYPWFSPFVSGSGSLVPADLQNHNLGYNMFTPMATITITGNTAGSFTLSYKGQTTGAISADYTNPVTLNQIQLALAGLSTIASTSNVNVVQYPKGAVPPPPLGNVYTINLTGSGVLPGGVGNLAGLDLTGLTASGAGGAVVTVVANRAAPSAAQMETLLRSLGTSSLGTASDFFRFMPSSFANRNQFKPIPATGPTGTANDVATALRNRNLFTSLSWQLDRIAAAAFLPATTVVSVAGTSPNAVITVNSTNGFPAANGLITVYGVNGTATVVTYTGPNTANTFTGCSYTGGPLVAGQTVTMTYQIAATATPPNNFPTLANGTLTSPDYTKPAPVGGGAGEFNPYYASTLVQRTRLNLNRLSNGQAYISTNAATAGIVQYQYDYPMPINGYIDTTIQYSTLYGNVPPWASSATWSYGDQFLYAQAARQSLAKDIYNLLLLATGAPDPNNIPGLAPSGPIFDAARWLAQLAVNIVDFIDNDDFSTPFNWFTDYTVMTATTPPQQYYVYGTEPPRVVINEAYAQWDNDAGEVALAAATKYHLNVWAELHNPGKNAPSWWSGVDSISVTSGGTGYTSAPTVVITPIPGTGGTGAAAHANFDAINKVVTTIVVDNPGVGYTIAPTVTLVGGGGAGATAVAWVDGGLARLNVGTTGSPAYQMLMCQAPAAASIPDATLRATSLVDGAPTTAAGAVPALTRDLADPATTTQFLQTVPAQGAAWGGAAPTDTTTQVQSANGAFTGTVGSAFIGQIGGNTGFYVVGPTAGGYLNDPQLPTTYNDGQMHYVYAPAGGLVGLAGGLPFNPTLMLQRLACPYMAPNTNQFQKDAMGNYLKDAKGNYIPNTLYNPYITVDYIENVQGSDARQLDDGTKGKLTPKAEWQFSSQGRRQPYRAGITTGSTQLNNQAPYTVVTAASNGDTLPPPSTNINVDSTVGFPSTGSINIRINNMQQLVSYTGKTGTSFTGCTITGAALGNLATGQLVTPATQPQNTFFRHNSSCNNNPTNPPTVNPVTDTPGATLDLPFSWLVHLDRPVVNAMELLHVSGYHPHELTQQFMSGATGSPGGQYAPWVSNQASLIYRALDLLGVPCFLNGTTPGSRLPGKMQINTMNDAELFLAQGDAQNAPNNFASGNGPTNLQAIFNSLVTQRTQGAGGVPWVTDMPLKSFPTVPITNGDLQYPYGAGIQDTTLRNGTTGGTVPQVLFFTGHPYLQTELLQKITNNMTTTSNVFAVYLTVGFFEVDDTVTPPKIIREIGRDQNMQVRHRMFAIVDRTQMRQFQTGFQSNATLQIAADISAGNTTFLTNAFRNDSTGTPQLINGVLWQNFQSASPMVGQMTPYQAPIDPSNAFLDQSSLNAPPGTPNWNLQPGMLLEIGVPGNMEVVLVTSGTDVKGNLYYGAKFTQSWAAGTPVTCRGNPGPWLTTLTQGIANPTAVPQQVLYNHRKDTAVVPYYSVIQ
jgi:hypothetical protein